MVGLRLALFLTLSAGCFLVPEIIIEKYNLPLPLHSHTFPYLGGIAIAFGFYFFSSELFTQNTPRLHECVLVITVAMICILWPTTELVLFHDDSLLVLNFLSPVLWVVTFYFAFKTVLPLIKDHRHFMNCVLAVPLGICLIQWLMFFGLVPGEPLRLVDILTGKEHPSGLHLNIASYIALFGIWTLLFIYKNHDENQPYIVVGIALVFMATILISQTRGAILGCCLLLFLKFVNSRSIALRALMIGIGLVGLFSFAALFFLADWQSFDESLRQRIGSLMQSMDIGWGNFAFGLGAEQSVTLRYQGMLSHTFQSRIFSSFGLIGVILFLISTIALCFCNRTDFKKSENVSGFLLIHYVMLLEPRMFLWFALVASLAQIGVVGAHRSDQVRSEVRFAS